MANLRVGGRFCKRGHDVKKEGLYANNTCRQCTIENHREYRNTNRESIRERDKAYYQEHRETIRRQQKEYGQKHRHELRLYDKKRSQTPRRKASRQQSNRRYREQHLDELRESDRIRSLALHNGSSLAKSIRDYYGTQCVYCGEGASGFDHLTPVSKGGETAFENLSPCCWDCNQKKRARPIWVMLAHKGGDVLPCLM